MKTIVIVDAYSAANLIAPLWRQRDYQAVHVQSTERIPDGYAASFRPGDFVQNFVLNPNLAAQLAVYQPEFCLQGIETGVELADKLCDQLGLLGNSVHFSPCRRDKYLMGERLATCGVRTIRQEIFSDERALQKWIDSAGGRRTVLKPTRSAGSDGVYFCDTSEQAVLKFFSIMGRQNKLGGVNRSVLAQDYVGGTEYAVNAVSFEGRHRFTHIWRYNKRAVNGSHFVYDWEELLEGTGPTENRLYEYVASVLDALAIEYGPSHAEVKVDENGFPVLIEVAARIDGLTNPAHDAASVGKSQIELWADMYTDPSARPKAPIEGYRRLQSACNVYLIAQESGIIRSLPGQTHALALPSFADARMRVQVGQRMERTVDLFTSPGTLFLTHRSEDTLNADRARIREIESQQGYFELA